MTGRNGLLTAAFVFFHFFIFTTMNSVQAIAAVNAKFDVNQMGDMSDFDPSNPVIPTGDTIKIAIVASFSGPAAAVGEAIFLNVLWAVHDYNKRGGIMVDGKKKLIQVIKADHGGKIGNAKKACERMALQERVNFMVGADGSHIVKVMNQVGKKYKIITQNFIAGSSELQDSNNFSRYAFLTWHQTVQMGRAFGYYYGKVRKKEKKFYILCQDFAGGHENVVYFKKGLKEFYPEAQIVGEDYHKLFLTDFAAYITKIKASGAEVIFSADWDPDGTNLLKQARQIGIKLPFAQTLMNNPATLAALGVEATNGLTYVTSDSNGNPIFKTPDMIKYYKIWHDLWEKKFKPPYNGLYYSHGWDTGAMQIYWLLSVIERAGSTDPEKIIKIWEGDTFEYVSGKQVKMRACDHAAIQDMYVAEYVPPDQQKVAFNIPPYHWSDKYSFVGPQIRIPAEENPPQMDEKLERCRGKNPLGD